LSSSLNKPDLDDFSFYLTIELRMQLKKEKNNEDQKLKKMTLDSKELLSVAWGRR